MNLDERQSAAVAHPAHGTLIVTGCSGTGKSTALIARARALLEAGHSVFAGAPHAAPRNRLAAALTHERCETGTIETLAFSVLAHDGAGAAVESIDAVDASLIFERAAEPLFLMEWAEFMEAQIDPEVPGLRAPQRFLEAAFRLIGKLRNAQMTPAAFLETALKGATQFYARPPNLAHPDLLYYTKEDYRNSLDVDARELQRQHRREVDLAKILEKLYRSYLDLLVARGCYTGPDAVIEAAHRLRAAPDLRAAFARRFEAVLVDDAQELSGAELAFLQALRGEELAGVTLCGDRSSAIGAFAGARPDKVFALPAERIELEHQYRCPATIERAARHLSGAVPAATTAQGGALTLFRATTPRAEAAFVAEQVAGLINAGAAPESIALLFRSVANVGLYEQELLRRNVDVTVSGDLNIYLTHDVLDALALLWNVHNPFAHDWMMRTLSGPAFGLSDASVVALCSEPENAQPLLFEEMDPSAERRWDPRRDVRLGWNVISGDNDAALSALALERLQAFRALRARWQAARTELGLAELAATVLREGLVRDGAPGSARARNQARNLARFAARIARYADRYPDATLGDFLDYASGRMTSSLEACEEPQSGATVKILDLTSALGSEFDHVFVPNVRAGSFPRYYSPDAFLFSPSLGMIAKENVGEAKASRTAKFSYYMFRTQTRETYNKEERRAFVYAMRRARKSLYVTASERPTRGRTSPEFLSELQAANIPGSADVSDQWRPAQTTVA